MADSALASDTPAEAESEVTGGPPVAPSVAKSRLYVALYGRSGASLHGYTPLHQLDTAIAYLRHVHHYDYYTAAQVTASN
jgi:hypothetical protein